jgi:hypothetical protein
LTQGIELPNVEPFGGEKLGAIAAIPAGMMGAGGAASAMAGTSVGPAMQGLPAAPQAAGSGTFSLPSLFGQ